MSFTGPRYGFGFFFSLPDINTNFGAEFMGETNLGTLNPGVHNERDGMGWVGMGTGNNGMGTWCGHQMNGIGEGVSPRAASRGIGDE